MWPGLQFRKSFQHASSDQIIMFYNKASILQRRSGCSMLDFSLQSYSESRQTALVVKFRFGLDLVLDLNTKNWILVKHIREFKVGMKQMLW